MSVIETRANRVQLNKPSHVVVTLYTGAETSDVPNGDTYILEDVIKDTSKGSQADNNTTSIECETSDENLLDIVTLGKYEVGAEIGDTQKALLVALCGFVTATDKATSKEICVAPSGYEKKYAKVDIVFPAANDKKVACVYPKVQLNSKVMLESLNSNLGRINLAGTAQNAKMTVTIGDSTEKNISTPFYTIADYVLPE